jgi:Polysaccharide pyruvyl transferase
MRTSVFQSQQHFPQSVYESNQRSRCKDDRCRDTRCREEGGAISRHRMFVIRMILIGVVFVASFYIDSIWNLDVAGWYSNSEMQQNQRQPKVIFDDPKIVLVPLSPIFPCNGQTDKVTCQKTLLLDDLTSIDIAEKEIDAVLQDAVCNELLMDGTQRQIDAPVCLQSADLVHVLLHYDSWMVEEYVKEVITPLKFVDHSDTRTIDKFIRTFPVSIRAVSKTKIDFPLSYRRINDKTNRLYEEHQDGNFGNLIWRYASSVIINPVTTDVDDNDTWNQTNIDKNPVNALVLASANLLHIGSEKAYETEINQKIEYINQRNIKTILLGIGVQYDFDESKQDYNTAPTTLKLRFQFQKNFMAAISERQTTPAIGVRGDLTKSVCENSGFTHCVATGCPSLTISRDINLGRTLESNWKRVKKMADTKGSIRIALAAPTLGVGKTFTTAYRLMATIISQYGNQVTIISQSEKDPIRFNEYLQTKWRNMNPTSSLLEDGAVKYERYRNVESWLEGTKKYDLCISFRIHGSMPFYSSGAPAVIIPTDFRIMELINAMKLPHVLPDELNQFMLWNAMRDDKPSLPSLLMENAKNTNFTAFEVNRREKLVMWKSILAEAGLEMDPALLRIVQSPL